jgi:alpha-glucuronidase
MMKSFTSAILILLTAVSASAESGHEAWLRYKPVQNSEASAYTDLMVLGDSAVTRSAQEALIRGFQGMLQRELKVVVKPSGSAIVLGTVAEIAREFPEVRKFDRVAVDGFYITRQSGKFFIAGGNDRGVLYGVFAFLRHIALRQPLDVLENPSAPIRWTNEWDNLDGTIERGYGGRSIFFADGDVVKDLTRVKEYARLLASLGINGCAINNVNASPKMLEPGFISHWAKIADAFRPWGIHLAVAVDFASPQKIGGLNTFDPLDPQVADWWREKADEVYRAVPDLAGFVVKADSEGRAGPSAYQRSHADAANLIARALQPHGGVLVYRAFVYNHHLDWNDLKADRAKAAYDNFAALDGKFDANVVIQIKHGPIDFQVREPVSPLIGALRQTNQALELQITQEYTGQQRHLCFLAPMWKEILDFDLGASGRITPVGKISSGHIFQSPIDGFIGVANVGLDDNWLGYDLAQANLYAFGRLAWNPELSAKEIIDEWTTQTFSGDPQVVDTIGRLQMASWPAYEKYTGSPLGLQTLTNIVGPHYGPGPDSADNNGWGQWIRAEKTGIGMDRTVSTGTGYVGQYSPPVAKVYESLKLCPDNLVLFFHHVPYSYVLHSGKTVIQTIYDSHYEGAKTVQEFPEEWVKLKDKIDADRYQAVLARLEYQSGHAMVWRDAIDNWFERLSGIADEMGRVGHHPGRVEAETMQLKGYAVEQVSPWYAASEGKAVGCAVTSCSASFNFNGLKDKYNVAVQYFEQKSGRAHFKLLVQGNLVAEWSADDSLPSDKQDPDTSTRKTVSAIVLHPGDEIMLEGSPDGSENASVDYVEITP